MTDQQDMSLAELEQNILLLKRQQKILQARQKFMPFVKFTHPDSENPNDADKSNYKNARHHDAIAKVLEEVVDGNIRFLILTMPPRHGKALAVDTPVPTPTGWTTMGALRPGDVVFDECGQQTRVIAKSQVWKSRPVWRVTADDGASVLADAEHDWTVRLCRKRPVYRTHSTEALATRASTRAPRLPDQGPLEAPAANLPIDPYVLGLWLGDGCSAHATITATDSDAEFLRAEVERRGFRTSDRATKFTFGILGLQKLLREQGLLRAKHIPSAYFRGSPEQRQALLQGLVDSDGHVTPTGQLEFCSIDRGLAEGVRELVHSLGYKASHITGRATLDGRDCGEKHRIMFYMPDAALLPRKAKRCRTPRRYGRYIRFEPAGTADTVCIQVDSPNSLFLAGRGMLPTHNSELVSRRLPAWLLGRFPDKHGIVATYNDDFAMDFGKDVRGIVKTHQFRQVFPDFRLDRGGAASDRLRTTQGGQWSFVGRGGSLTGRGGHILICDDLIKDDKEAQSKTIRDQAWNWLTKVAMTRRMGKKLVIMTFTRWHSDDPIGRLTDPENEHYNATLAKRIKIINFPAIAEDDDPLGREPGEPLWPDGPDLFDLDFLEEQRALDPLAFEALYQQRPSVADGTLFRRESVQYHGPDERVKTPPMEEMRVYCASDHAVSTKQRADSTVLLRVGLDRQNNIYLLDCWWRKAPTDAVVEAMLTMGKQHPRPMIWWAEKGHISQSIGPFLRKRMSETSTFFNITEMTPSVDKQQRAQAISARMAMGRVYFPKGKPWVEKAINQLLAFPNGLHDDFVDAFAWIGLGLQSQIPVSQTTKQDKPAKSGTFGWFKQQARAEERRKMSQSTGGF